MFSFMARRTFYAQVLYAIISSFGAVDNMMTLKINPPAPATFTLPASALHRGQAILFVYRSHQADEGLFFCFSGAMCN
jgi:hypothetical protein